MCVCVHVYTELCMHPVHVSVCRVRLHQSTGSPAEHSAPHGVGVAVPENESLQDRGG